MRKLRFTEGQKIYVNFGDVRTGVDNLRAFGRMLLR